MYESEHSMKQSYIFYLSTVYIIKFYIQRLLGNTHFIFKGLIAESSLQCYIKNSVIFIEYF